MSVPVLALFSLLARTATYVITRPTLWLVLLGWFAVSRFDFRVAFNQLEQTIAELWWLVALILLVAICNIAYQRGKRGRRS